MAERQTSDPRRSGERRQAPRSGEQRQMPRSSDQRQAPQRRQQAPSRRNDVIRCENCGEDYSITYKRCPFCDERPVRGGIAGKRVANTRGGGYGRPASTLRIAGWVVSFAVILCAAAIVVRFMGAPIFGGKKNPDASGGSNSSQSSQGNGAASLPQPGGSSADISGGDPVPLAPGVEAVVLNTLDTTLDGGKTYQLTANLLPAGVTGDVIWTTSDPTVATVDATGLVTNVNARTTQASTTIIATCGPFTAQCTVYCNPTTAVNNPGGGTYVSGSTMQGVIVGADTGLNIRSGTGTQYEKVASGSNGAEVTVLGEENGWYHIRYSGTSTGYVSKEFVSIK